MIFINRCHEMSQTNLYIKIIFLPLISILALSLLEAVVVNGSFGNLYNDEIIFVVNTTLLDENFTPVYITPICVPLRGFSLYTNLYRNGRKLEVVIDGYLYINCEIDKPIIKLTNINKTNNIVQINLNVYFNKNIGVYRKIIRINYQKATIIYSKYNESYYYVSITLQKPVIELDKYTYSQLWFDENDAEIMLEFIVNKESGQAYLVDNGKEIPVGSLPLLPTVFSADKYIEKVKQNAYETVLYLKNNQWILEQLVKCAREAENIHEKSSILINFTGKILDNIFGIRTTYLGLTEYGRLFGQKFKWSLNMPFSNLTGTNKTCIKTIRSRLKKDWDKMVKELRKPVENLIYNNDSSELKDYIMKLFRESISIEDLACSMKDLGVWDFPINKTRSIDFVLPLTQKYRQLLRANYMYVSLFAYPQSPEVINNYKIIYKDIDIEKIRKELITIYPCISRVENELGTKIIDMLDGFVKTGKVDVNKLDSIYEYLVQRINSCKALLKDTRAETIAVFESTTTPNNNYYNSSILNDKTIIIIVLVSVLIIVLLLFKRQYNISYV